MSEEKLFIKTPAKPVAMKMNKTTLEKRSSLVWKFLEKRELINIHRLADRVEYDHGNFWRLMNGKKKMTQTLLLKVEKELQLYGFNN